MMPEGVMYRLLLFAWFALGAAADARADASLLRLSHGVPKGRSIAELVDRWAERIGEKAGNQLEIKLFPGNQLLRSKSQVQAVARGHIEAALISNIDWGLSIPEISIFSRPFAFMNYHEFRDFLESPPLANLDMFAGVGAHNLAWIWITDVQGFTSNRRPLVRPADFRQLKIRGMSAQVNTSLMALGAAPVTMSGGEAYQALQTNLIDASLTTLPAVYHRRYYEIQEWCTITPVFITVFTLAVNKTWWKNLDDRMRAIINTESKALEREAVNYAREEDAILPDLLRENGMQIHVHTQAEIERLAGVMLADWEQNFILQTGARGEKMLSYYNAWREQR